LKLCGEQEYWFNILLTPNPMVCMLRFCSASTEPFLEDVL
jgi:hypothetical protein